MTLMNNEHEENRRIRTTTQTGDVFESTFKRILKYFFKWNTGFKLDSLTMAP